MRLIISHLENLPSIKISLWLIHHLGWGWSFAVRLRDKLWTVSAAISAIRSWKERRQEARVTRFLPLRRQEETLKTRFLRFNEWSSVNPCKTDVQRTPVLKSCSTWMAKETRRWKKRNFHRGTVSRVYYPPCFVDNTRLVGVKHSAWYSTDERDCWERYAVCYGNARIIFLAV